MPETKLPEAPLPSEAKQAEQKVVVDPIVARRWTLRKIPDRQGKGQIGRWLHYQSGLTDPPQW
jgi:hypothetical protein